MSSIDNIPIVSFSKYFEEDIKNNLCYISDTNAPDISPLI